MRNYITRFGLFLLLLTLFFQILIGWAGNTINVNRKKELADLQISATKQWVETATFVAENPPTLTSTAPPIPPTPSSTPISCIAEALREAVVYAMPIQGLSSNSLSITEGDNITIIGRLKNEPWWLAYYPDSSESGWIQDEQVEISNQCNNLNNVDLSYLLRNNETNKKILIQDTFNGFDYEWRDSKGNPSGRPAIGGYAQLQLEDRSALKSSEEVARIENTGIPSPFGFIISINPFSFDSNSYIGFRYKSASDPDNSWIQFKLIRKFCTVEWAYSLSGEVTTNPPFTLGESAGCSNDDVADYLHLDTLYNPSTDAMRFAGIYNDTDLPSLTVFDRDRVLQNGSFELIVSKSEVLFDFIIIYETK